MAKFKVQCAKDLSGVFQSLESGSKYVLSFDGKQASIEEIPASGVSAFVDGDLTDITPVEGDVTVIDSTGVGSVTPIADGDYTTAGGDVFSIASGMITAFVVGT